MGVGICACVVRVFIEDDHYMILRIEDVFILSARSARNYFLDFLLRGGEAGGRRCTQRVSREEKGKGRWGRVALG